MHREAKHPAFTRTHCLLAASANQGVIRALVHMGTNTLVSESVRRMESPMRAALLPETACHRCTTVLLLSRCVRQNHFDSARPGFEGATGVVPTSSRWCDSYLSSRQSRRQSPGLHTSSNAPCGWPNDPDAGLSSGC